MDEVVLTRVLGYFSDVQLGRIDVLNAKRSSETECPIAQGVDHQYKIRNGSQAAQALRALSDSDPNRIPVESPYYGPSMEDDLQTFIRSFDDGLLTVIRLDEAIITEKAGRALI